jgi:predicted enzyme related to lactoylglutathione lyase
MNNLAHFAIHSDNVERTRRFYAEVFDWKFNPYGPPNFYQIHTGNDDNPGVRGALQERHDESRDNPIRGFECTISVESLDETIEKVTSNGGTIVLDKCSIPGVGSLIKFTDTEGNLVVAMEYELDVA